MLTNIKNKKWWMTAIWLPFLWVAIQNSKGLMFWQTNPIDVKLAYMEGSPLDRIVLSFFIVLALIILWKRKDTVLWLLRKNIWLVLLIVFMAISVLWSEFAFISFKRWIRSFGTLLMILLIFSEERPFNAVTKVVELLSLVFILGSLFFILFVPSIGTEVWSDGQLMWNGLTNHKNTLGEYGAIGAVFYFWRAISFSKDRFLLYSPVMFVMSAIILVGSKSFTSLAISCVVIMVMLVMKISNRIGKYGVIFFILVILTCITGVEVFQNCFLQKPLTSYVLEAGDKDPTLTGRTDIWQLALEGTTTQEKILGKGYAIFWESSKSDHIRYLLDWDFFNGHNGYIDFYLQLGIIGEILLCFFLLHALVNVVKTSRTEIDYSKLWAAFFLMAIISNLSETNFGTPCGILWFLMLIVSMPVKPSENNVLEAESV
jgi:O-antigen ligase